MDVPAQTNGHTENAVPGAADLYELDGVSKVYGSGSTIVTALAGVSLTIGHGAFVAISGQSGSGKTTLLQLLGALDRPTAGSVRLEGHDLTRASDRDTIGFIFQH